MNTKLAINLAEGTVHVEGTEEFVRSIYDDFKAHLTERLTPQSPVRTIEHQTTPRAILETKEPNRKKQNRKAASKEGEKSRIKEYKPKFNSRLDLAGLDKFYDDWKPINNNEKILVFATFLRDRLKISPCTADDIYTCFFTLKSKTKTPEAFVQAFRDAQSRTHFIEFISPQEIHLTIAGDNHFNGKKGQTTKESA